MLRSLSVQNYALISGLEVNFYPGLSTITGETGAGKSILMGALSLLLGARADTSVLYDKSAKCIVEAGFSIGELGIESFFREQDLDYDTTTFIRREILPSGKSRAFVNDTPVNLPVLKDLGDILVDIHAQHHNLMIKEEGFPLRVIDAFLGLESRVREYQEVYSQYLQTRNGINRLREKLMKAQKDQDYLEFQFKQLEETRLVAGEEEELTKEQEILTHAEEIGMALGSVIGSFSDDEQNILLMLKKSIQEISSVKKFLPQLEEPGIRLDSVYIEMKDLAYELEQVMAKVESDPQRLAAVNERLDLLYTLQKKHQAGSSEELIAIRDQISNRLQEINTSDLELMKMSKELELISGKLNEMAGELSKKRAGGLEKLSGAVVLHLREVGMPHAQFEIGHSFHDSFTENGIDRFSFLFAANKNQDVEAIHKVASGGEISRLMLSIKSLVSQSLSVPTLIFDEIDAGVSGEVADKMGKMLKRISGSRQVINVTHLPQVAGRGDYHYQVYKFDDEKSTRTAIRLLNNDERIMEMAKMLSGEKLTEEAVSNARALLQNN